MILFSGALLLTPGFFTDAIGFALLLPPVRAAVYRWLSRRMVVHTVGFGPEARPNDPDAARRDGVIEGEFVEVDPPRPAPRGRSGWTQD